MKRKKIILYHTNPLQFGGVDTFDYNFCKKMRDKYNILFLYKEGNLDTIKRLQKLNIEVEKYNKNKRYVCDICLLASAWGGYPENVIARTGRYIQMIHADYIRAKETGFVYEKWHKTTEYVAVVKHVTSVFKKLYPKEKVTTIYNILDDRQETHHILKLISATRVSKEKGYDRMLKLAQALKEHNIKFIGPTADSMRKMGDKATARQTMIENNVPVTPGTGILKTPKEVKEFAKKAGYPIILKATAGGGGKGMRICRSDEDVESNMNLCQAEAQNFFGNPDVYAEKYLENPRHIEVQILGDQYGNVVHLGERDCSIQRRHQKLIEEAPSPAIDEKTRQEMGAAAVRAAKAIKYEGAGTCEFLLDHDGKWYFMEMNTRIQVEHCVTEMISNVDLVREQIMVAAGEKLDFTQEDIVLRGHAIECRINAENPEKDFMPNPGQITGYVTPGGFGVRVDSHVYQDYSIPPYYDSMIGKLICWGRNRNEARRRMYRALKEYVITGIETTLPFHQDIIEDPVFVSGNFNTGFIEDYYERTGKHHKK